MRCVCVIGDGRAFWAIGSVQSIAIEHFRKYIQYSTHVRKRTACNKLNVSLTCVNLKKNIDVTKRRRCLSRWNREDVYREEIAVGIKIKCDFLVYIRMHSIMFALKGNGDETLWFVKMTCVRGGCRRRTRLHEGERSRAAGNREWHFAGVMAISGRTRGCAAFIRHSSWIVYCRWAIHIAIYVGISIQIL